MRLSLLPMTLPLLLLLLSLISTVTSMDICLEALPSIEELPKALKGVANFGFKIMNNFEIESNILISPLTLWKTFAYAAVGAEGETLKEILNALGLTTKQGIIYIAKNLGIKYNSRYTITLSDATRIYMVMHHNLGRCNYELSDIITQIDMSDPVPASQAINTFIKTATKGQVISPIESGMTWHRSRMILLNALYFKGVWKNEFEIDRTSRREFYDFDKSELWTTMMYASSVCVKNGRTDILLAHVVELPYDGNFINMSILFPYNEGRDPFKHTLQRLNEQNFMMALKHIPTSTINLHLPKFTIETKSKNRLMRALRAVGIKSAFQSKADFSTFRDDLFIDDVIHMAKITVDEDGVTAGSASESLEFTPYARTGSHHNRQKININRPFIFVVHTPDIILFTGAYVSPEDY